MNRAGRASAIFVLALAALWFLWPYFDEVFPLRHWYLPHVVEAVVLAGFCAVASLSLGLRVLGVVERSTRRDGHLPMAFVVGVGGFGFGLNVLGHFSLFGPTTFWLYPIACLLVGLRALIAELDDWVTSRSKLTLAAWEFPILAVGALGLFLAAFPTFDPANLNYDAQWYHFGIAERYALVGGIDRSGEGSLTLASPHFASVIYSWAMQREGSVLDRFLLAQQLEVLAFVGTLALLPALTRALSPELGRRGSRWAWVVLLLFPSIYIYDTGLMGGADHLAAFFAAGTLLAWRHGLDGRNQRWWAVMAALLGLTILTKYTAAVFLVPMVLVVIVQLTFRAVKGRSLSALTPLVIAFVAGLVVTAPLWLRNLVWYHNPIYPFAGTTFPSQPWTVDGEAWATRFLRDNWQSTGPWSARAEGTLAALWNYHLKLYTWESMTKKLPIFGFLFSAALVLLPFVERARRSWSVVILVHLGIALWWNYSHQLRYLLVLVPGMAAVVAVVLARAWELGLLARCGVGALVGFQLAVAAGVPFLDTHAMNGGRSALAHVVDTLGQGLGRSNPEARLSPHADWVALGAAFPPRARAVFHNRIGMPGIGRLVLVDEPGLQFGISYGRLGSWGAIHRALRDVGATHAAWIDDASGPPDSVAGELLFRSYARGHLENHRIVAGRWHIADLGEPPKEERGEGVLYLSCGRSYSTGLYRLADLTVPVGSSAFPPPRATGTFEELEPKAQYIVRELGCDTVTPPPVWTNLGDVTEQNSKRTYYARFDRIVRD